MGINFNTGFSRLAWTISIVLLVPFFWAVGANEIRFSEPKHVFYTLLLIVFILR